MSVKTIIQKRRSIRKYQDKKVSDIIVRELIDAARLAPSAYNAQPSRFFVVKSFAIKQKLKDNKIFKQDFVYTAPIIIVCCADQSVFPRERFESVYSNPHEIGGKLGAVRDLSIATQNLVLMATELGLGTCYVGLVKRDKIKEILDIRKNFVVPFVITVGYPTEKPKPTPRNELGKLILNRL
jgi:nitroreductase